MCYFYQELLRHVSFKRLHCSLQETAHYFMECTLYDKQHLELIEETTLICQFDVKTLKHGNYDLAFENNCRVFDLKLSVFWS